MFDIHTKTAQIGGGCRGDKLATSQNHRMRGNPSLLPEFTRLFSCFLPGLAWFRTRVLLLEIFVVISAQMLNNNKRNKRIVFMICMMINLR